MTSHHIERARIKSPYVISGHVISGRQPCDHMILDKTLSRYALLYHLDGYRYRGLLCRLITHQDVQSPKCLIAPALSISSSFLHTKPISSSTQDCSTTHTSSYGTLSTLQPFAAPSSSELKTTWISSNFITQLLTVHAIFDNWWRIPCAHGLYTNLMKQLDEAGDIHPDTVLIDYEKGLRNAIFNVWPWTTIRWC